MHQSEQLSVYKYERCILRLYLWTLIPLLCILGAEVNWRFFWTSQAVLFVLYLFCSLQKRLVFEGLFRNYSGNNFCLGYQTSSLDMSVCGAFVIMYFVVLHLFFTKGLPAYQQFLSEHPTFYKDTLGLISKIVTISSE